MAASSPSYAKVAGEIIRAAAAGALPGAGAYDTAGASFVASVIDRDVASLWCTYTRGGASGSAKIKIYGSCDNGATFALCTIVDPATAVAGGVSTLIGAQFQLPVSSGAAAEEYILPPIDVSALTHIMVLGAEVGATGTPGSLIVTLCTRRAAR